jgi:hypothetical protein
MNLFKNIFDNLRSELTRRGQVMPFKWLLIRLENKSVTTNMMKPSRHKLKDKGKAKLYKMLGEQL